MKGKAAQIIHFYLDHLWRSGSRTNPTIELVAGISADDEIGDEEVTGDGMEQAVSLPDQSASAAAQPTEASNTTQAESNPAQPIDQQATETVPTESSSQSEIDPLASAEAEDQSQSESGNEASSGVSVEEMDALIMTTFLQAIKRRLKDSQLPMLASTFHSSVFLPCRPKNTEINWKRSSFKKVRLHRLHTSHLNLTGLVLQLSVFLYKMYRELDICYLSEDKPGVIVIEVVNREHPVYETFPLHSFAWVSSIGGRCRYLAFKTMSISATHESEMEDSESGSGAAVAGSAKDKDPPFQIREFFALPKGLLWILPDDFEYVSFNHSTCWFDCFKPFWSRPNRGKNDFNSAECVHFMWAYVAQEKLAVPEQPANVKLNPRLAQALWPKSAAPDVTLKAELAKRLKDQLQPMHEITIDGETTVKYATNSLRPRKGSLFSIKTRRSEQSGD